jgi:hypothetical protein
MSTNGIIARPKGDGWEGRYHHWDSYPSGLGKALWSAYHERFARNLHFMTKVLIDQHPAGWSTIISSAREDRLRCFRSPGYADAAGDALGRPMTARPGASATARAASRPTYGPKPSTSTSTSWDRSA